MKPTNYTPYHIHTMLSNGVTNIDSITDFHDYVDKAKEYGMKAFGFAEHGSLFAWLKKKEYIESCGMKYIHAVEAYLTEDYEGKPHLYSAVNLVDTATSGKTVRVKFYNYYKRENEGDWAATINEEGNPNNGKDTLIDIETLKDEGYKKTMDNVQLFKQKLLEMWEECPNILLSSSLKANGKEEILSEIENIINQYWNN